MLRIKSKIRVQAYLRRCNAEGAFAAVLKSGDEDAGIILVKIVNGDRLAQAFVEVFGYETAEKWRSLTEGFRPEPDVDEIVSRELRFDRDIWVIEVEDRQGRSFLDNIQD